MSEMAFVGQRQGEKVKLVFRRHPIVMRKGVGLVLVIVALGVLPMLLWPKDERMFYGFMGAVVVAALTMMYAYIIWYFSVFIVTDQRIRQIVQRGVFRKTVVDLELDKIESVSFAIEGVIGGMFGYGTLLIQTSVGDMTVSKVGKIEKVYNKVQNIVNGR